jgi:DNA-binding Lrp family transcriptional regulator
VIQELDWFLRLTTTSKDNRAALYEQWQAKGPSGSQAEEAHSRPLRQALIDVFHQGRVSDLFDILGQLVHKEEPPTLQEIATIAHELLQRPLPLSSTALKIVKLLHADPTISVAQIVQAIGFPQQTVANRIRRLYYALQIKTGPLVDYHAVGLRHMQVQFRGPMALPASSYANGYLASREILLGAAGETTCDTWLVPTGHEAALLDHYRPLEETETIQNVSLSEFLSFGKNFSLASYEAEVGWRSDPEPFRQILQKALEGEAQIIPPLREVMPYGKTSSLKLDGTDIRIIESLRDDYLLSQSDEAVAIRLNISRAAFNRRLQRLEANHTIQPTLWLNVDHLVQTAVTIPIPETQVLNALLELPLVVFFLAEDKATGAREWRVWVSSPSAIADGLAQATWPNGTPLTTYRIQQGGYQSPSHPFRDDDFKLAFCLAELKH